MNTDSAYSDYLEGKITKIDLMDHLIAIIEHDNNEKNRTNRHAMVWKT